MNGLTEQIELWERVGPCQLIQDFDRTYPDQRAREALGGWRHPSAIPFPHLSLLHPARQASELAAMSKILELIQDREVCRFEPGQIVMEKGAQTHRLYVLIDGTVEVVKDDVRVSTISEAGATFGEISVLLEGNHTATVRALTPCSFHVLENPRELLQTSPRICFQVCVLLARRLDSLTRYLVDVKQQFEGHDHIGMVDEVLEALLHRQPKERVPPRESTIRSGEPLE